MRFPKLRVRNVDHAAPEIGLGDVFLPFTEIFSIERGKLRRHPGLGVNPVRHTRDRHFVRRHATPDVFPKRATDFAMQSADAI